MSSIPSPNPIYLTGIWNWSLIPITTPPLAVPSSLVMASSFDSYASGSDDEGDWKQYNIHGRVGTGSSDNSDYLEGFMRNNPTKIYGANYAEVEISPEWFSSTDFEEYNYVDLMDVNLSITTLCS